MPGPYDIYGDYEQERTLSSRIPFGMGGTGAASWLPELGLLAAGSLQYRKAIKNSMGHGLFGGHKQRNIGNLFGLAYTDSQSSRADYVEDVIRRVGHGPHAQANVTRALHRANTTDLRAKGWRGVNVEARVNLPNRPGKGNPNKTHTKTRRMNVYEQFEGVRLGPKGQVAPRNSAYAKSFIRQRYGDSAKLAKAAFAGKTLVGLSTAMGSMALTAAAFDMGETLGTAVMDYRPRKDSGSPFEFGDPFFNDNVGAYTQRQRAIMAIHDSQLTTRAAIGGEAAFMHN